jgi:hypothetical protein
MITHHRFSSFFIAFTISCTALLSAGCSSRSSAMRNAKFSPKDIDVMVSVPKVQNRKPASGSIDIPAMGGPLQVSITWNTVPGENDREIWMVMALTRDSTVAVQFHASERTDFGKNIVKAAYAIVDDGLNQNGKDYYVQTVAPALEAASKLAGDERQKAMIDIATKAAQFFGNDYFNL